MILLLPRVQQSLSCCLTGSWALFRPCPQSKQGASGFFIYVTWLYPYNVSAPSQVSSLILCMILHLVPISPKGSLLAVYYNPCGNILKAAFPKQWQKQGGGKPIAASYQNWPLPNQLKMDFDWTLWVFHVLHLMAIVFIYLINMILFPIIKILCSQF